jgi:hypothetical protein
LKIDPFVWLRDILNRVADHPVTQLDQLLRTVGLFIPANLSTSPTRFGGLSTTVFTSCLPLIYGCGITPQLGGVLFLRLRA